MRNVDIKDMMRITEIKRISWFGHIPGMASQKWLKKVWKCILPNKRGRGRPRPKPI